MKKILLALILDSCLLIISSPVLAITNPLAVPNNRVGVHILDPIEISEAAKLVNSNGGDWGYVTIPIRSNDRDYAKWHKFFEDAKKLHVIPIIRIATYPVVNVWETPTVYDLVDFANFLSDMPWSTKNRYVVLFNEPNHAHEWGGQVDPYDYARLLVDANKIFKSRSQDFFLLSAGLDMSVPNSSTSREALLFYQQMTAANRDWYANIDGLGVHSYPNPGFSASPFASNRFGISSFKFEEATLTKLGLSGKPLFITETGTIKDSDFYFPAFQQVWTDPKIVAITPFVLFAGSADFANFSLLNSNRSPKRTYNDILGLPKTKGSPLLTDASITQNPAFTSTAGSSPPSFVQSVTNFWQKMLGVKKNTIQIKGINVEVSIADNPVSRAQGLSGKEKLKDNEGMLFKFETPGFWQFWMKDMNFALDFIWVRDHKIVEITSDVLPPSQTNNVPQLLTPKQPVDWVLEVNAGFAAEHQLQVGEEINEHHN